MIQTTLDVCFDGFRFFVFSRITSYSTAIEDIANSQETPASSIEEQDTGCTVIEQDANESIRTTHSMNVSNASELSDDLMKFDEQSDNFDESNTIAVKAQPSNGSVITVSSDGSQETAVQETPDKCNEIRDEEIFERSISCPPTQLQDELFDDSSNDVDDSTMETDDKRKTYE